MTEELDEIFKEIQKHPYMLLMKQAEREQQEAWRCGYRRDDYCWNCGKYFEILRPMMCGNGSITYHCLKCYKEKK